MESRQGRMTSSRCDVILLTVMVCVLRTLHGAVAETVYFNSYGDCLHNKKSKAFSLQDEAYTLLATGAREMHETLVCRMIFQAPSDTSICLTFRHFQIDDCGVVLDLYQGPEATDTSWKRLTCEDRNPPQMCTQERYVTVKLSKRKLNLNRGYAFKIHMEKTKGEDFLASTIGLFVGIIAGVIGIIVIIAVIVLCCCCKPCRSQQSAQGGKGGEEGASTSALQQPPAQPSAPPAPDMEDEHTPLQPSPWGATYPALPQPYPGGHPAPEEPPPYAPPPYELHNFPDKL